MKLKNNFSKFTCSGVCIMTFSTLLLAGCGGGSGGGSTHTPFVLHGTNGVGDPVAGATVTIACVSLNGRDEVTFTSTTDANGNYTADIGNAQLPCSVVSSGGTTSGGAPAPSQSSAATSAGTVNITPITDEAVAIIVLQQPSTNTPRVFAQGSPTGGTPNVHLLTQADVDSAVSLIDTKLSGLGLGSSNPITSTYSATATPNPEDNAVKAFSTAKVSTNTTAQQIASALISSDAASTTLIQNVNSAIQTDCASLVGGCGTSSAGAGGTGAGGSTGGTGAGGTGAGGSTGGTGAGGTGAGGTLNGGGGSGGGTGGSTGGTGGGGVLTVP